LFKQYEKRGLTAIPLPHPVIKLKQKLQILIHFIRKNEHLIVEIINTNLIIDFYNCRTRHRGGPQNNSRLWKKNRYLASGSFREKQSCLRSHHLVLWSLGTLTGQ
jgi:hypothetical protein